MRQLWVYTKHKIQDFKAGRDETWEEHKDSLSSYVVSSLMFIFMLGFITDIRYIKYISYSTQKKNI